MRKIYTYAAGFAIITLSVLFSQSCDPLGNSCDCGLLIGSWPTSPSFDGGARSEATSFTIGEYAYVSTGVNGSQRFQDVWEYDTTRQYWVQKANLPGAARNSAVSFSIGTKGYIGTGYDGVNKLNDLWEYDQATNTWTQKDNFPGTPRYDAVAFSLSNKGYISCGYDGNYKNDLWQFDPSAATGSQWKQKANIQAAGRSAAQVFVLNNKAYICSGNNNSSALNDLWMYNDTTDTWFPKRPINNASADTYDDSYTSIARFNGVVLIIDNLAYMTTGVDPSLTSATWEYDPNTDLWSMRKNFGGPAREGAIAFSLGNRGFIATGRNSITSFDDCYELKSRL